MRQKAHEPGLLNLTKANSRSTVHRPSFLDYVGVKWFSAGGEAVGERRFLGRMASEAYRQSPQEIPVLRRRVQALLDRAGYRPDSYDGRMLLNILEIRRWHAENAPAVSRCLAVLRTIAADDRADLATLSGALREVRGLLPSRSGLPEH